LRAEQPGGSRQAELAYWIGCANAALGNLEQARQSWTTATVANESASGNRRGNQLAARAASYFQALAFQKLGQSDKAGPIFNELVKAGTAAPSSADDETVPVSRQQPANSRVATAHYLAGLGYAGLGDKEKARAEFNAALAAQPDHLGAKIALTM
jgi:tetratricopeptide (TPR) repeat protein